MSREKQKEHKQISDASGKEQNVPVTAGAASAEAGRKRAAAYVKRIFTAGTLIPFGIGIFLSLGIILLYEGGHTPLALAFLAAALLLLIIFIIHTRKLRRDYRDLESLTRKIMSGDRSEAFPELSETMPLMGELGEAMNLLLSHSDQLLEKERQQSVLQETILAALNEGIILTNVEGEILFETPQAERLLRGENSPATAASELHYKADGGGDYIFLRGVNAGYVWDLMKKALSSQSPELSTLELFSEKDRRYVEVYAAPIVRDEERPGALAVLRDVTHMKQLEEMRRDFVANVTHELKTPLTSIKGYIELLQSRQRTPEEAEQFYTILEIEADRLENLISDLLELSEIEGGDRQRLRNERIYLYSVADEVMTELGPQAEARGIKLHLDVDPDFSFAANRHRIKQLIVNLMSNAVKYNKDNGDVYLTAGRERGQIRIQVRDNGIGIAEEHLPRLFERFYRVSKSRSRALGGTGLGLAIVKHIAGLYGGTVQVASELGKGTVFTVYLPDRRENDGLS